MKPSQQIIDLLKHDLGEQAQTEKGIAKAIYKGTSCGAWVSIPEPNTIEIGSIVENGDQEIGPRRLVWPFTLNEFWETVQAIDDEAWAIWEENELEQED